MTRDVNGEGVEYKHLLQKDAMAVWGEYHSLSTHFDGTAVHAIHILQLLRVQEYAKTYSELKPSASSD